MFFSQPPGQQPGGCLFVLHLFALNSTVLTIGGVTLQTNLLLAPIAGYCDLAFRITCRRWGGVGLACTDLLSPQGLLRGRATSLDLARTNAQDQPVGMQLYGADPEIMAEGAVWAVEHGATVVDINMGCPVDKVTKKDGGSRLLCIPDTTERIVRACRDAVDRASGGKVPLTCKMRLGWFDDHPVAVWLAPRLIDAGVQAVTIHGRTTQQKFMGNVSHDGISRVVEAVGNHCRGAGFSIPVIGNGDVRTPEEARDMVARTGCSGVMIGRGALAAPWLFRDAWSLMTTGTVPPEPTDAEKIDTIESYMRLMLEYRDEHYAIVQMRRRISWFGKRLGRELNSRNCPVGCKPLKMKIRDAKTPTEMLDALDEYRRGGLRGGGLEVAEEASA